MKCYVCGTEAINRLGRSNLCAEHGRFLQMQKAAKRDGKYIPSIYELQGLVPKDMRCGDCGIEMNWIDGNKRSSGAVLQHYRNGTLGITCMSCNTKHGLMPGDSYKDLPKGHKLCGACKTIKPLNMFGKRSANANDYPKSKCKTCELDAQKNWRLKNPERYKQLNKTNNQKKKLDPDKYKKLDKKYYQTRKEKNVNKPPAF